MTGPVSAAEKVGHFACGAGEGSLVRVGLAGTVEKPPATVWVERCPACGGEHRARTVLWRNPAEFDIGRDPAVLVDAEGRQL